MANRRRHYAAYIGDTCIGCGYIEEIAKLLDVAVGTARFYATPAWRRRAGKNSPIVEKVDV